MSTIAKIRKGNVYIIVQGMHLDIIQSILDYDSILGRKKPSVLAIIAQGRKRERFHWGDGEIEIPVYVSLRDIDLPTRTKVSMVVNVQSARNVKKSVKEAIAELPQLTIVSIFAENTPEQHTLELLEVAKISDAVLIGPSSVGILIPGSLKLGAIGGTTMQQLHDANITEGGDIAVITTSGGMVNELIRTIVARGRSVSFAIAMGGDRFPLLDPSAAMLLAEKDPQTKEIIYFGELGGDDEYHLAELIKSKKITKPIIAYIAGVVSELFDSPPQFGHAKAMAQTSDESAKAKKIALRAVGVKVCDRFGDVTISIKAGEQRMGSSNVEVKERHKAYFMSHISGELNGDVQLLGRSLIETVEQNTIASLSLSMLLGEQVQSKKLVDFTDLVLRLLVDHSPNVSGAVNTMISARAGKDLVSSLVSGLLTIGPRFGGAINTAAEAWLNGIEAGDSPKEFVRKMSEVNGIIPGIGHKKYRTDNPDPRVKALIAHAPDKSVTYIAFARSIEAITTTKKTNLILNVDGAIAAIMLDLLTVELHYSKVQLRELVNIEFFNALFVLSRSVGFTAHYLDQKRNDEGLFRQENDDIRYYED